MKKDQKAVIADNDDILNQSGQSLVEFILLMSGIVIISFTFMRVINGNIADRWQSMATMILDDPSQSLELK